MPAPNYNIFEYRNLRDAIAEERGHALERNTQHYKGRNGYPRVFGLHIAVVHDDTVLPDLSGENLNNYGATTTRQASWHVSVDTDTICVALRDAYTAWVQGVQGYDFNSNGLGAEIATLQTDWRKIPEWRQYRFLRHLAAWWAPRVMKYKNVISLQRDREVVQRNIVAKRPAAFAYHGDLDPANRTDPGLIAGRVDTFPIEWFFELLYDEINIRLWYHDNVYNDTRFAYKPYTYGARTMQIFCLGEDVLQWQKNLNAAGFTTATDRSFGPGLTAQTLAFQAKHNMVEDGAAGPGTQAKMKSVLNVPAPKPDPVVVPKPEPEIEVPETVYDPRIPVSRVGGANRFDTNWNLVAQRGEGGERKVYVIGTNEFNPDGFSVSGLNDGIIASTYQANMPSVALNGLVKYNPTSVVIVGGANTVSDTVLRQIQAAFPKE